MTPKTWGTPKIWKMSKTSKMTPKNSGHPKIWIKKLIKIGKTGREQKTVALGKMHTLRPKHMRVSVFGTSSVESTRPGI